MSDLLPSEQYIHPVAPERARKGKGLTPQQRREARSVREILRKKEHSRTPLTTEEKIKGTLLDLNTQLEDTHINGNIDNLPLSEKMKLLQGIGYPLGEQIVGELRNVMSVVGQKAHEAIPITAPIALISATSAHNFAERNPQLAAYIAAADEGAILAAGMIYLSYKSIKGTLQGENCLTPTINFLKSQLNQLKEDPGRKGTKLASVAAGYAAAILALEDPEGAGTTIVPILGSIAAMQFTHKLTEKLITDIADESQRRPIDITDPTFLISTGITTCRDITENLIANVRDSATLQKLWGRLSRKTPDGGVYVEVHHLRS